MNPLTLAQEIIDGRRITREDDLSFSPAIWMNYVKVQTAFEKPVSEAK